MGRGSDRGVDGVDFGLLDLRTALVLATGNLFVAPVAAPTGVRCIILYRACGVQTAGS
jgi:hypothetical protein